MLALTIALALAMLLAPSHPGLRGKERHFVHDRERLLAAVTAELRAGSSLRYALAAATRGEPDLRRVGRLALAGAPLPQPASPAARRAIPVHVRISRGITRLLRRTADHQRDGRGS